MLILFYWPQLSQIPLAVQVLRCCGKLALYVIPSLLVLLPIRFLTKVPSFIFRKLLHIVAFTGFAVMTLSAESWAAAALTCAIFALILWPIDDITLNRLRGECVKEVKKLNGSFSMDDAVHWQRG